jgi:MinD-like ATPase involved in chromosome partitioning or flagellar assembly
VSVERAEAGRGRPEPPGRWRSLLDRALRTDEDEEPTAPEPGEPHIIQQRRSPENIEDATRRRRPVDPRPLDPRPLERRPVEPRPLDPRPLDHRPVEVRPLDARPLDARPLEARPLEVRPAEARGERARTDPAYPGRVEWQPAQANGAEQLVQALRRDFGKPRVIAFANPKGGVHKTTATVLCAATIGGARGRGVLAWDDNELRGTLGLRAGSARHARTIRHLISDLAMIEIASETELTERLDDYLRHASDGSYDVLAGEENPRFAQRLDPYTVRRVLELLCRTHEVVCVDTGNNVESPNWKTVLQAADQLVITSVPREDAAFTADWMLDLLHEMGMGQLAEQAVTLLSCPTPNPSPLLRELADHFAGRTRSVVVVPYDPALESGSSIEYGALQPGTRRAWLEAAAVITERFSG